MAVSRAKQGARDALLCTEKKGRTRGLPLMRFLLLRTVHYCVRHLFHFVFCDMIFSVIPKLASIHEASEV